MYARAAVLHETGFRKKPPPRDTLANLPAALHLSLRRKGGYLCDAIAVGADLATALDDAVKRAVALRMAYARQRNKTSFPPDLAETLRLRVTLFLNEQEMTDRSPGVLRARIQRGLHGLGLRSGDRFTLFAGSKAIVNNYSHPKLLSRLSESLGLEQRGYQDQNNRLYLYDTISLYQRAPGTPVLTLYRDDHVIPLSKVTPEGTDELLAGMAQWLVRMVRKDGRMEYKYMPARGEFSKSNNMIRQWMATLALAELFNATSDERYAEAWKRNVTYNLAKFYRQEKDYGHILYNGKSKLGSLGIALLALARGPEEERGQYLEQKRRLQRAIEKLWHDDGSFTTFLYPRGRNDNQSFYPGEALLGQVVTMGEDADQQLLDRWKKSKQFYMDYYQSTRRYTPFVPWHTMAYWHLFQRTGDAEYRGAIYEMNDWLINLQNLDSQDSPDLAGRFYIDEYAFNGPPHASSTAVYVEGLAYAYNLARRDDGNEARAQAYLRAICHGLRSLMQLQYRDVNSYYLSRPQNALGGLRTRVTDNQLRVDNTQHAIMAVLAVKRFVAPEDLSRPDLPHAETFRRASLRRFRLLDGGNPSDKAPSPGKAVLLLGGDTQLGRFTEVWGDRHGLDHHLRGIGPEIARSDALIVNLECVVSDRGQKVAKTGTKVWHLRASPHMLGVFPKNKLTAVSIANNHSMDYGPEALMDMVTRHLPQHRIQFAGGGKDRQQAEKPAILDIGELRIAMYSFTTIQPKLQATETTAGYNWITDGDLAEFKKQLQRVLNADAPQTDLQVLSIHWGSNYEPEAPRMHEFMARAAVDMGIDMVIGHSAHINHGIEVYRGVPIFYDLGNFLVDFKFQGNDDRSIMPRVTVGKQGVTNVELIPISLHDKAVTPAIGDLAQTILQRIGNLSQRYGTKITPIKGRGFLVLTSPDQPAQDPSANQETGTR